MRRASSLLATAALALSAALTGFVVGGTHTAAQVAPAAELISVGDDGRPLPFEEHVFGISGDGQQVGYLLEIPIGNDNQTLGFAAIRDRSDSTTESFPTNSQMGSSGIRAASLSRDGCFVAYWMHVEVPTGPVIVAQPLPTIPNFPVLPVVPIFPPIPGPDATNGLAALPTQAVALPTQAAAQPATDNRWQLFGWNRCANSAPFLLSGDRDFSEDFDVGSVAVSANGQFVAYSGFLDDDTPGVFRVNTSNLADRVEMPFLPASDARDLDISDDGQRIVFGARDLGLASVFLGFQVMQWIPSSGQPAVVISLDQANAEPGAGFSGQPSISGDGRFVAFTTSAENVVGQFLDVAQVVVRDLTTGQTRLVTDTGTPLLAPVSAPDLDIDGSAVAVTIGGGDFSPSRVELARGAPGFAAPATFDLVSFGVNGLAVGLGAADPVVSSSGNTIAFDSEAGDQLTGDPAVSDPRTMDVWLRERVITLAIDPGTVNFGSINEGASAAPRTVTVTNTSRFTTTLQALTGPTAPFARSADGCSGTTLVPAGSCTFDVRFGPGAAGAYSASVTASAEGASVAVDLRGSITGTTGTTPTTTTTTTTTTTLPPVVRALTLTPPVVDFGSHVVGTPIPDRTLTVRNTGTASVSITSTSLSGPGATRFSVSSNDCSGATLAVNATCDISVGASVDVGGTESATITVSGSGGASDNSALRVTGTFDPTLTMSPAVARYGEVTTAVGVGFPPNRPIDLTLDGEAWMTATSDGEGAFRRGVVLIEGIAPFGNVEVAAVDQPEFSDVTAPLLINPASFRPRGFDAALAGGVRSLYARG